jgi:hypothetical protein
VRYNIGFDIVNATNSGAVLTYYQTFNPSPQCHRRYGSRQRLL